MTDTSPATDPATFDFLVIGSGVAGLTFALRAARNGSVAVVTKREIGESNTRYAQGGVAAVMAEEDSPERHAADTHVAGAGLCEEEIVRIVATEGPERVRELIGLGVPFNREEDGALSLGMEGGHSARRILHVADTTGAAIQRALVDAVRASPNVTLFEQHFAVELITRRRSQRTSVGPDRCLGVHVLDRHVGTIRTLCARATVLAAGGAGKVYLYTSNPDVATGDGIAMAYRAGCEIANMEFVQFHPTCLYHPQAKNFLISEALRGEGGVLRNEAGEAFMERIDPRGNLAPRDIVARGIDHEMKRTGADCVVLDMTALDAEFLRRRFPAIHRRCLDFGIDITTDPIPVVPAAHYLCGGVATDEHGQTGIDGLFAVGEVAYTGLHGANRLASNSLLEGLVFAHRAADRAAQRLAADAPLDFHAVELWDAGHARPTDEEVIVSHAWDEVRRCMWNYVGIVRSTKRLLRARRRIESVRAEIEHDHWEYQVTVNALELRNLATCAMLIVESALRRHESRGLHYTLDYPDQLPSEEAKPTVLDRLELEGVHWLRGEAASRRSP